MKTVYVLQHVHEHSSANEDIKFIGVYSTECLAKEAIERLKGKPGFRDAEQGFHIGEFALDQDHWTDGFVDGTP